MEPTTCPNYLPSDSDFGRYATKQHVALSGNYKQDKQFQKGNLVIIKSEPTHRFVINDLLDNGLIQLISLDAWGKVLLQNVYPHVLQQWDAK